MHLFLQRSMRMNGGPLWAPFRVDLWCKAVTPAIAAERIIDRRIRKISPLIAA